jgi:hypothetical protein
MPIDVVQKTQTPAMHSVRSRGGRFEVARPVERPHAVDAHVAERHRLDRFVEAPGCHPTIVGRTAGVGEGFTVLALARGGISKPRAIRSSYRSALEPGSGQTERKVRPDVAISVPRIPGRVMSPCIALRLASMVRSEAGP